MTKKKNTDKRYCRHCGDDISHMRSDAVYCWKQECRNAFSVEKYEKRVSLKICKYCGAEFLGKGQERNCPQCRGLRKDIAYKQVEQKIVCKHCGKAMSTQIKNVTRSISSVILSCCRQCFKRRASIAKTGKLNPNWKGGISTPTNKFETPEEMYKSFSIRMRINNPMGDPIIRNKVALTIKSKYEAGTITKKLGPKHWLWKGNRKHSFVLRTRLGPWHNEVLRRDHYECQNCGSKYNLEVHHVNQSFSEIVEAVLLDFNLDSLHEIDVSSVLFQNISDEVVKRHSLDNGVTYCKTCHSIIDSRRRI